MRSRRPVNDAWTRALDGEVGFWRRQLLTYHRLSARIDATTQLQPNVAQYIEAPKGSKVCVLDVGAGPLTWLGKTHPDYDVELRAADTLGEQYGALFDEIGLEPPVRTEACDSEKLTTRFERDYFDVVYARNTLDHSYEPIVAIREMLAVTKPGGVAVLEHARNEAEEERYLGLHQWNFAVDDGRFVIWRPGEHFDVARELSGLATVERAEPGLPHDHVVLRKPPAG